MALGNTYFDLLIGGVKRLFYLIYNLFDDWILPKPPVEPEWKIWKWGGKTYDTRSVNPNIFSSGSINNYTVPKVDSNWSQVPTAIYDNLISHNTNSNSWTNSLYNILWYTGITVVTLSVGFLAYSIYTDPGIITKHIPFRSHGNAPINPADAPDININDNRTNPISLLFENTIGLYNSYRGMLNILNPFYWLSGNTTNIEFDAFLASQANPQTYNSRYYPFTIHNPHDSWLTKLRFSVFGESDTERLLRGNRERVCRDAIDNLFLNSSQNIPEGSYLRQSVAGTGVNTPLHGSVLGETVNELNVKNAFARANIPLDTSALPDAASDWSDHKPDRSIPVDKGKAPMTNVETVSESDESSNVSDHITPENPAVSAEDAKLQDKVDNLK